MPYSKSKYSNIYNLSIPFNVDGKPTNLLETKLWNNPCPFTFRINYLALLYNTPLYKWVLEKYKLKRPDYVVLFSLALSDGSSACEVSNTSGFPKNTLSRAIKSLEVRGLLKKRNSSNKDGRKQSLYLSKIGWQIINETMPIFEEQEKRMLKTLTIGERQILFELLSKVVLESESWSNDLALDKRNEKGKYHESK